MVDSKCSSFQTYLKQNEKFNQAFLFHNIITEKELHVFVFIEDMLRFDCPLNEHQHLAVELRCGMALKN